MGDLKKLAGQVRAACIESIDLLKEIIKVKRLLGQDVLSEKNQLVLMLGRFEKIKQCLLKNQQIDDELI